MSINKETYFLSYLLFSFNMNDTRGIEYYMDFVTLDKEKIYYKFSEKTNEGYYLKHNFIKFIYDISSYHNTINKTTTKG